MAKVSRTGCPGVHQNDIGDAHPQVLSVTGPQKYDQVVSAVHQYSLFNKQHDHFTD